MKKTQKLPKGLGSVKIDTTGLERLKRGLMSKYVTQVGVMGSRSARQNGDGDLTNADIGLKHEKGSISEKIPRRSFLEMPIFTKADEIMADKAKIKKWVTQMVLSGKDPKAIWKQAHKKLGVSAEAVIQEAFESRGFGKWKPNTQYTIDNKKGGDSPLIDKSELRKSVTSRVK